jgi:hypothetical protein
MKPLAKLHNAIMSGVGVPLAAAAGHLFRNTPNA